MLNASTFADCVSIFAFASAVGIPVGITTFTISLEICIITTGIKK